MQRLVVADAQHAREAHRDAALVARAAVDALEAELEDQARPDAAHRAELLERGLPDDAVDDLELLVGEARVGLGERHQLQRSGAGGSRRGDRLDAAAASAASTGRAVPDREGVVGVDARAPAVAGLRVDQHAVDAERIDLPFPPGAAGEVVLLPAAGAVARLAVLEHEALDAARARFAAQLGERAPVGARSRSARGESSPQRRRTRAAERRLEQRAPLVLRPIAQVVAVATRAGRRR